jgi:hypothetical protein
VDEQIVMAFSGLVADQDAIAKIPYNVPCKYRPSQIRSDKLRDNPWTKEPVIYMGFVCPVSIALMTCIAGSISLKETRKVKIWDEVGGENQY